MRIRKKTVLFLMIAMLFLGVMGCSPAAIDSESNIEVKDAELEGKTEKIKFTDLANREIVLDGPAERIFLGFYAESFLAINQSFENVVCISKAEWADFFNGQYGAYEKNIPELANIIDTGSIYKGSFSMETTMNLTPDVAILAPFQYETLGENVGKLEAAGTKVVVVDYNSQKLENHVMSTKIIGMITGKEENAEKLAKEYVDAVNDVQRRVAHLKEDEKKRVYIELGNLGALEYGNSYGEYMWGSLVMMAGGNNIAHGKVESYGALSPEYILSSDPEIMFFAGSQWINDTGNRVKIGFGVEESETHSRLKPYRQRPGWDKLSAIKNDEIYAVDHAGLRSIYDYTFLQFIGKSLYPELFEDIDPEKNIASFYERYLPVKAEGCFMTKYTN